MVDNDCTIVVNSCDSYEDLWLPFFSVMHDKWANCRYPIILNTESKSFRFDGLDIRSFGLQKSGAKDSWGRRLRETLSRIRTEYVIMLFDDFFLEGDVDQDKIETCLTWLRSDRDTAVFYFSNIAGKNLDDDSYEGFERLPQRKDYRLNSAPALWRRERLIAYTGESDDPWSWEFFGSARTFRSSDLFFCAKAGCENIYQFNSRLGGAIHRGKWVLSVVKPVIEKYGIELDLMKRGIEDERLEKYKRPIKWKMQFFLKGFRMVGLKALIFVYRSARRRLGGLLGIGA